LRGLSAAQVNAFMRHVYTVLGSVLGTIVILGFVTQGDATGITNAIHQIGDGVASIAAGVAALVPIVSGIYAARSASLKSQVAAVQASPVAQVITSDPKLAQDVPGVQVGQINLRP
jgi:hypothetical protein